MLSFSVVCRTSFVVDVCVVVFCSLFAGRCSLRVVRCSLFVVRGRVCCCLFCVGVCGLWFVVRCCSLLSYVGRCHCWSLCLGSCVALLVLECCRMSCVVAPCVLLVVGCLLC